MGIFYVAPFAGAWIEIIATAFTNAWNVNVAPFAGAWIEMHTGAQIDSAVGTSLPSRERGLKS